MNKSQRMQMKAVVVLIGIIFLVFLVFAGIWLGTRKKEQPQGEYIKQQDANILLTAAGMPTLSEMENVLFSKVIAVFENVSELEVSLAELEEKYEPEHFFLKEDWYTLYDEFLVAQGLSETITRTEIVSLGAGSQVTDSAGTPLAEQMLITVDGAWSFQSLDFLQYRFVPVTAYQKEGELLTVYAQTGTEYQMHNVWMMESVKEYLQFFWNNYEVRIDYAVPAADGEAQRIPEETREQIADIVFKDGQVTSVQAKMDKVNGKILSVTDSEITVEGIGTLPFSEHLKIYQIYDVLTKRYTGDLRIGYDFADFVIQDGCVEACLITRDEAMENIRVLIKNSDYNGRFHETVSATADTDFVVRYGTYDAMQEQSFSAGDVIEIGSDSEYFIGDRVIIEPVALTGKVKLLSVSRSQGTPQYRGRIEVVKTGDGLAVINEVLLEEYLYCVVPSEMPSSYPLEALKAQAVCARTYAYQKMIKSGLPSYGAHVDDSTNFQVYNNIKENVETTKAVRETKGQLLYTGDKLVEAYYYSTSCGFGTTAAIWKADAEAFPYLQAKRIGQMPADEIFNENTMTEEETFRAYITSVQESDYESAEGWYRWQYSVEELDCEILAERMRTRQEAVKNQILTQNANGEYEDVEITSFSKVKNISCGQRGAGGVLHEVLIDTDAGLFKIVGEYNIRYVLNNGEAKVNRQDGSEVNSPTLLPSSFIAIDLLQDAENVVGYTIIGGGFGHGVGMSQNGARNMASQGMTSNEILGFFYDGSSVVAVY